MSDSIDNPEACGTGKGAECCIYLVVGGGGFECARETMGELLRNHAATMTAQRQPTEPRPDCQLPAMQ